MARTRAKAKARRGGEGEHFARLPESVLQHPALATAPHHALRALAALVCGYSEQQNGSMMLTGSYAAKFGLTSHDTLTKALRLLEERGIIETTRRVARRMKVATLFGVTWWEIHFRNGERLDYPEPASHRYRSFAHPATRDEESPDPGFGSSRPAGDVIPPHGMNGASHHPETGVFQAQHHPAPRGHSKNLGGGEEQVTHTDSATESPQKPARWRRGLENKQAEFRARIEKRILRAKRSLGESADPHSIARKARVTVEDVLAMDERPNVLN